jgi:hypothetical protein
MTSAQAGGHRPDEAGAGQGNSQVAALSNTWGTGYYDPYAGWDLDDLFDAVVIADRARTHS